MENTIEEFNDVASLLEDRPIHPAYCIFPHIVREKTREFLEEFPGRVLYAVKANSDPNFLKLIIDEGVTHFDCASLPEIEAVHALSPTSTKYFMIPTRIRGAAKIAQDKYGVKHFLVDHLSGLEQLLDEIDPTKSVIFARMAVHHASAFEDLSKRFGAQPEDMPALLEAIRDSGAEPAFAFNVGSNVTDPEAYRHSMAVTRSVLDKLPFKIRLLDVGGGYPRAYPDFPVPEVREYFNAIRQCFKDLPLADNAEVLGEPGRALAAPGVSAVVEVILRKDDQLYINDGMFGVFWLLRIDGANRFAVRTYRDGKVIDGEMVEFQIHGPTCDSTDTLPGLVPLPADIRPGDYLEFGNIGAYSISGRTDYNGFYSDRIVTITSADEKPPYD